MDRPFSLCFSVSVSLSLFLSLCFCLSLAPLSNRQTLSDSLLPPLLQAAMPLPLLQGQATNLLPPLPRLVLLLRSTEAKLRLEMLRDQVFTPP